MLKKQTVWLLTMLSLLIVLSVYYMSSTNDDDLAYMNTDDPTSNETTSDETSVLEDETDSDDIVVENIEPYNHDELFTTIRLELQNERSMKKDVLKDIVASGSASTDEKNEALNDIELLDQLTSKEMILQDTILASTDRYADVLVRFDDHQESEQKKVHVHVKVDELSKEEVINIMQMVRDEFGQVTVDVNFQPTDG